MPYGFADSAVADLTPWPAEVAQRYRDLGYWTEETLGGFLRNRAARFGDRPAVRDACFQLTYRELDRAVDAAATRLREMGVQRGDRFVVQIDNRVELYVVHFALFRLGAVPVLALAHHGPLQVEQFCRVAEAVMIIATSAADTRQPDRVRQLSELQVPSLRHRILLADTGEGNPDESVDGAPGVTVWPGGWMVRAGDVEAVEDVPDSEDLAFLQLSGGSTGVPKLVPRTHADYLYSVRGSAEICSLTADDVMLIAIPAAHNFAYSSPGALGIWHVGGCVVLAARPAPDDCLPELVRSGVTIVPLVPAVAHLWLLAQQFHPRKFPRLRVLQVGGAKLSCDLARALETAFRAHVQQVFGMAEGLVNFTRLDAGEDTRTRTQGRPISPHDELRVVDDAGVDVAAGEEGHLLTRGPYTIRGYYRDPAADRASFTEDGWYRTGDVVRIDARGNVTVTGRTKAIINRGGHQIAPKEIEFHLRANPDVADAVLAAVPDDVLGERTRAFVVPKEPNGLTARQVRTWLRGRGLAGFKVPDQVYFVSALEQAAGFSPAAPVRLPA